MSPPESSARCGSRDRAGDRQVVAIALAHAISLLERAPAHWIRPGLLFELHALLEQLARDPEKPLKVARTHARKLVKEPTPTIDELH
jgi:hypothetical protein